MFDCFSRSSSSGTLRGLLQGFFPSREEILLSELKLPLAFVFRLLLWAINGILEYKIENCLVKYTRVKSYTSTRTWLLPISKILASKDLQLCATQ